MIPVRLGVNIDHVATLRNARGGTLPDPLRAALSVIGAGADSITIHLREDRRHIVDSDVARIKAAIKKPLNLEMAATPEMLEIALGTKPHAVCLVPEKREERTTEGGLDAAGLYEHLVPYIARLNDANIRVSLFIAPDLPQIEAAKNLGAPVIEIHTGTWCERRADGDTLSAKAEFERIRAGAAHAAHLGLEVHAGHGLDYASAEEISALPQIAELNIGHFMMGEALFVGLPKVIETMRAAIDRGQAQR